MNSEPITACVRFNQLFKGWCRYHKDGNPYKPYRWVHDDWDIYSRTVRKIKSTMLIGNYCYINTRDGMTNCWVDPPEYLIETIKKTMLPIADDETNFSMIVDGDEARIYIKHGKIIGSRFLARIKADTIPEEIVLSVV